MSWVLREWSWRYLGVSKHAKKNSCIRPYTGNIVENIYYNNKKNILL